MRKTMSGFTIVELLVVVVVIIVLAGIGSMAFTGIQKQSRDAERSGDIAIIQTELERYYRENNEYPSSSLESGTSITSFYESALQDKDILSPGDTLTANGERYGTTPFCTESQGPDSLCKGYVYFSGSLCTETECNHATWNGMLGGVCSTQATFTPNSSFYLLAYYSETDNVIRIYKAGKGNANVVLTQDGSNPAMPNQQCNFLTNPA